jgi:NAD(P)-dependent dehydrogenase (short-subunit alcohol dehydrogenase family)
LTSQDPTDPGALRFDGRVAVVTGAGRGIGRAYARLLAARGASVVVNDLGASMGGDGVDEGPAADAVNEIIAAGGTAVADGHDIATADGAAALVAAAVERFGRLDALVNNAGIMRWARFPDVSEDDLAAHLAVHLTGSFHTARAAWPHLVESGSGRIVMTTSSGVFGLPNNTAYAAAKGGVIGLSRSLSRAGARAGIKVNCIAPAAMTRMAVAPGADDPANDGGGDPEMAPDLVAPMVAFLAHEDCPVTGQIYTAGSRHFARVFLATTPGWVAEGTTAPTIEDVAAHWSDINDEAGYTVPADLMDWSAGFLAHLA